MRVQNISTVLQPCKHTWDQELVTKVFHISLSQKMNSQYIRHEVRGCETSDLRNFWEKTIEQQTRYLQIEKERQQRSALTK